MKNFLRIPFIAIVAGFSLGSPFSATAQHQTETLTTPLINGRIPYSVEIKEVSLVPAAIPNIHSIAGAEWNGHWIILAGRTNGLHGMTGMNAFDPAFENRDVWVIDPAGRQSWHKSLEGSGLDQDTVDSLSSVNTQFYQDGNKLLIIGGYGYKRSVADHVTYDTLSVIDLPGLVAWVKSAAGSETTNAEDHIHQIQDTSFQVTGGALEKIGDEFQLVFGQNYSGRYRPGLNGVYTQQVRRFKLNIANDGALTLSDQAATRTNSDFRRRDLNALTILQRSGIGTFEEKIAVFSGVFTPNDGAWTAPVFIGAGGEVEQDDPLHDTTLKQGFQIYHCAKVTLYHRVTDESHTLLFGGITVLERDTSTGDFTRDDSAPFTNQCGLIVRAASGRTQQYWLPTRFPLLLSGDKELRFGTNAEFFPAPDAPRLHPRVLDLAVITQPTVIGHIFGGIVADAGNGGSTGASGRIFEVILTPVPTSQTLNISTPNLTLSWDHDAGSEKRFLVEESENLQTWRELSAPLADITTLTPADGGTEHYYRALSALPTKESN